jgi:hypothetical protein
MVRLGSAEYFGEDTLDTWWGVDVYKDSYTGDGEGYRSHHNSSVTAALKRGTGRRPVTGTRNVHLCSRSGERMDDEVCAVAVRGNIDHELRWHW